MSRRPGFLVYGLLAAFVLGSTFPLYWSFVIVTSTIGGLQIFTEPRLFDTNLQFQGGADYQYQTLTMYVFNTSNSATDPYPRAAAATWVIVLIIIAIALLNLVITRWIQRRAAR